LKKRKQKTMVAHNIWVQQHGVRPQVDSLIRSSARPVGASPKIRSILPHEEIFCIADKESCLIMKHST